MNPSSRLSMPRRLWITTFSTLTGCLRSSSHQGSRSPELVVCVWPCSPSMCRAQCCAWSARPTSLTVVCRMLGSSSELRMADAMRHAVHAGRLAYLSGRIPKRLYATASSPEDGVITAGPKRS